MASEALNAARRILAEMAETSGFKSDTFDLEAMRATMRAAEVETPERASVSVVDAGGVPAEWVCDRDASPDRRLVHYHAGAYVCGGPFSHRAFAAWVSEATGCSVLVPDYRLAPENPFPAALEDAVIAYRWMLENGPAGSAPAGVAFAGGDSAGGGLVVATLLALRDEGRPLPAAAYTISAYADLTFSGASIETRADMDPMIGAAILNPLAAAYLEGADPRNPLVSPVFGDLRGLPPLLVQVGDAEILLDDSVRLADRAGDAGLEVTLEVWPEMFHCWHTFAPMLPEGREAIERIGAFIRSNG